MNMAVTASFLGPFNNRQVLNMCSILHECKSDHSYDVIILMYDLHASSFSCCLRVNVQHRYFW